VSATVSLPFFGGELSSFDGANDSVIEDTTAGTFNATYSRCALSASGGFAYARSPVWASASAFWFHSVFTAYLGYVFGVTGPMLYFYSGSTVIAQLVVSVSYSSATMQLQTLQSGVMTNVAGTIAFAGGTLYTLDINLGAGASGSASLYINGAQQVSVTGLNHSAWTGVTQVVVSGADGGAADYQATSWWSQVICDSSSTLNRYLITTTFTNESATNNQWSGAGGANNLANIGNTSLSDATYISAASSGLTDTFYESGLSLTGYYIMAVGVAARARVQGSGPANIKMAIRVSSANYVSPQFTLTPGFTAITYAWTNNPALSGPWSPVAAAAIEVGVQSVT